MKHRLPKAQIFYGLHFSDGLCHYGEADLPEGVAPFNILVPAEVAKEMDPTMAGCPVFVKHVRSEREPLQNGDEDGWVSESFFNPADGFHWAKFEVITEEGLQAIKAGWTLSNAWDPAVIEETGDWHSIEYQKRAGAGSKYRHLAIVETPRYEESTVKTPEEFKAYNDECERRQLALRNSKEPKGADSMGLLEFFNVETKATKLDDKLYVTLPLTNKKVNVLKFLNDADAEMSKNPDGYANPDHKVKLHDGRVCNVGQLVALHKGLHDAMCNEGFEQKSEEVHAHVLNGTEPPPAEKKEEEPPKEPMENEEEKAAREKEEQEAKEKLENAKVEARAKALALKNAKVPEQTVYNAEDFNNRGITGDEQLAMGKKLF